MNNAFFHRFIMRAMESGLIGVAGLAAILVALILPCCAPYLVAARRNLLLLFACSLGLGVSGYVACDWQHFNINLCLRDAESVRRDCIQLLQRQSANAKGVNGVLVLRGSQIPLSFIRLGAKFVRVSETNVQVSLVPESGFGGYWGILYDPKRDSSIVDASGEKDPDVAPKAEAWNEDDIRPTWYRDFYEFIVRGE